MLEEEERDDVLTIETLRGAFKDRGLPRKHYYPIHPFMWDDFLRLGWTEKELADYGFLKNEYIGIGEV